MSQPAIQTNFSSGELAPKLRSRVDVAKYKSAAAYMRNFFVDFSGGGASTRQGTRYVNQCKSLGARIIPFQPSVNISYVLEFGQNYIRFYSNGAPVLESAVAIQSITGSPVTVNSTANGYANGDWVFISGTYYIVVNAATNSYQLTTLQGVNVLALTGTQAQRVYTITSPYALSDLFPNQATGNPGIKFAQDVTSLIITHPSYSPYILTINSAASWTLTAITFGPTIAAPTGPVIGLAITGTGWFYSYIITAVDNNGQESVPSAPAAAGNAGLLQTTNPGAVALSWNSVPGAVSYNIYKASPSYNTAVPAGAQYGFISNVTTANFRESFPGIGPDFSQTPPLVASPTTGGNVTAINLTGNAVYTVVPTVTLSAAPGSGLTATAFASLQVFGAAAAGTVVISSPANPGNPIGVVITLNAAGIALQVTAASNLGGGAWQVTAFSIVNPGSLTGAGTPTPANPVGIQSITGGFSPFFTGTNTFNLTWEIGALSLIQGGFGYTAAPGVTFAPAGATATTAVSPINQGGASTGAAPAGNPRAVSFYQQRLALASPNAGLQSFYFSQPGSFFNFNVSNPSQADNGIFGSIVSEELNDIRSLVPVPTGLMALTGKGAWLLNGGGGISTSSPITPSNISATPQAFNGANDLRPLKTGLDLLYVTNKGNYVRDNSYNIYANIFTGNDITVLSNHLFFGYQIVDWAWAEEPFKVAWAVRNDGQLLSLSYNKEAELIGWAHHDTNGQFRSTTSVIETTFEGNTVDATYFVIRRFINGGYYDLLERMADRYFTYGYEDAWSVDCGLQTAPVFSTQAGNFNASGSALGASVTITDSVAQPFTSGMVGYVIRAGGGKYQITAFTSASQVTATVLRVPAQDNAYNGIPVPQGSYTIWQPITTVSGLTQLTGQTVVGVADGAVIGPVTVSAGGTVTLSVAASKVTLGLAYLPQLQTLPLDLGEQVVQGRRKKITGVSVRVADTLGLQIGKTFQTLVTMKDFQIGAIPTTSTGPTTVTDLVNASYNAGVQAAPIDGRTIIDQEWDTAGNYCIQQNLPYPATILAVMPEVTMGDTAK